MIKRFTKLAILLGAIGITATTVSFSYFYFGGNSVGTNNSIQDLHLDNIYENYDSIVSLTGGEKINDKTYTIYVFPSAEYLQIYYDYLNKGTVAPELFNGWLEPVFKDNNQLDLKNGRPQYRVKNHKLTSKQTQNSYASDAYVDRIQNYNYASGANTFIPVSDNKPVISSNGHYAKYKYQSVESELIDMDSLVGNSSYRDSGRIYPEYWTPITGGSYHYVNERDLGDVFSNGQFYNQYASPYDDVTFSGNHKYPRIYAMNESYSRNIRDIYKFTSYNEMFVALLSS